MSQADVDTVYRLHKQAVGRVAQEGMSAWPDYFAPHVVLQPPNGPVVRGLEAPTEWSTAVADDVAVEAMSASGEEYMEVGDCIIETGEFTWRLRPKAGGEANDSRGKYLAVWQRQDDGSWKIIRDCWNSG
jgi:ketosteroid isomerase-like protein